MARARTAAERKADIMELLRGNFPQWDSMEQLRRKWPTKWRENTQNAMIIRAIHKVATVKLKRWRSLPDAALTAEREAMRERKKALAGELNKLELQERAERAEIERAARHKVGAPGGHARADKLKEKRAEKEAILASEVARILAEDAQAILENPAARRLTAKKIAASIYQRQTALGIGAHYRYTERAVADRVRRLIRAQRGLA